MLPDYLLFAPPGSWTVALVAALFGLLIGSFLNVVIHRLPKIIEREFENSCAEHAGGEPIHTDTYTLAVPRSACPHCQHKITALENIPVVSYLALGGKCKGCKAPISPRYPIIEIISAVLAGVMAWTFGSGWAGLGAIGFALMLLVMTMIDFDTQYLFDQLTAPLLWAGLLLNAFTTYVPLKDAVLGAAAGYAVLWGVNALFRLVRKKDGMGGGDFMLLAGLGAWMGWQMLPAIILLSSIVGSVVGLALIVFARHGRHIPIPFGPYLAGAGLIGLLYMPEITLMGERWMLGQTPW